MHSNGPNISGMNWNNPLSYPGELFLLILFGPEAFGPFECIFIALFSEISCVISEISAIGAHLRLEASIAVGAMNRISPMYAVQNIQDRHHCKSRALISYHCTGHHCLFVEHNSMGGHH